MNEEEKILKFINEEYGNYDNYVRDLLDLYNKEKEKNDSISIQYEKVVDKLEALEQIEKEHKEENGRLRDKIKELEEIDLTTVYMDGIYDERDKWKIKVKKKIEEIIQNSSHFNMISPLNYDKEYYETRFAVDKLQELLEERN